MSYQSSNGGNREEAGKDTKDDLAMFYLKINSAPMTIKASSSREDIEQWNVKASKQKHHNMYIQKLCSIGMTARNLGKI